MLRGWHSGSHALGRLRLALTLPPAPPAAGQVPSQPPSPARAWGCPARGAGGTDPVGRRLGGSKSCPRTAPPICAPYVPHMCPIRAGDCAPSCPTSGPTGPVLWGTGGRAGGSPGEVQPPPQRVAHGCAGVHGCRGIPVPRRWPDPDRGEGRRQGGLSHGGVGGYGNPVRDVLGNPPNPRLRRG